MVDFLNKPHRRGADTGAGVLELLSAIYEGPVVHSRLRPRRHRLTYRVFSLLLDLDELQSLDSGGVLGINRPSLLSFWEKDHGSGAARGLRRWVSSRLADEGFDGAAHSVQVLCYPRILGFVFNPLTVYFCRDVHGVLRAVIYEVNNTFGERQSYVLGAPGSGPLRQRCDKALYVSPFIPMDCSYAFEIEPPGDSVAIRIDDFDSEGLLLRASFVGKRRPLTEADLRHMLLAYPLMTIKVVAGIHWEALRLWLKGVPLVRRGP